MEEGAQYDRRDTGPSLTLSFRAYLLSLSLTRPLLSPSLWQVYPPSRSWVVIDRLRRQSIDRYRSHHHNQTPVHTNRHLHRVESSTCPDHHQRPPLRTPCKSQMHICCKDSCTVKWINACATRPPRTAPALLLNLAYSPVDKGSSLTCCSCTGSRVRQE